MTPTEHQALREQLIRHEGIRLHAYQDSLSYWTIGVGRLIDVRMGGGISMAEAMTLLDHDIETCLSDLRAFLWFEGLDAIRQRALCDLRFNVGQQGLRGFPKFLAAMERGDYHLAAKELAFSKWYLQVGYRARILCYMVERGEEPPDGPRAA